jgi:hypothetical protein
MFSLSYPVSNKRKEKKKKTLTRKEVQRSQCTQEASCSLLVLL